MFFSKKLDSWCRKLLKKHITVGKRILKGSRESPLKKCSRKYMAWLNPLLKRLSEIYEMAKYTVIS